MDYMEAFDYNLTYFTPNMTMGDSQLLSILNQDMNKGRFSTYTEYILICCFSVLIVFGALGNGLVCYVVGKNPHMRTPRNIFIISLAISDLTLCLFTQPINLYKLLRTQWALGEFMCKFVPMFQGTNVFVSTISITAIALDRFQVIVYPTKDSMKKLGAVAALLSIWIISFLIASPLLIFSIHKTEMPFKDMDIYLTFRICYEDTSLQEEKGAYSVASMVVQYILPIVIVTIAHLRICNKLKYRMANQQNALGARSNTERQKQRRNSRRKRRTNILLASIGIIFALSWLPLNIFNILSDFRLALFLESININLVYVICHMLVLSSACTNPVLYGWLNENFKNEFLKILCKGCCIKMSHFCQKHRQNGVVIMLANERHERDGHSVTAASTTNIMTHKTLIEPHVSL
ncbi:neuropeptide F receptor-like [Ostrea edulis]|uniref:neuropeptide F receptor-like n=1 Tax=Ostrea edulis TaxID=37623 RepID=UPI0024AEBAE1|nr:neuropeptide F receptor-like [Ostrea edulis]